jgi:exonuclease III
LKETQGFKIAHINTGNGGLLYHLSELTSLLDMYKLDVLAVTETWLSSDIDDDFIKIDGYEITRHDNTQFIGQQGVALYIKESIPHNSRPDLDSPLLMARTVQISRCHAKPILITATHLYYSQGCSILYRLG